MNRIAFLIFPCALLLLVSYASGQSNYSMRLAPAFPAPELISKPEIKWPHGVNILNDTVRVYVSATVTKDGEIKNVRIAWSSSYPVFDSLQLNWLINSNSSLAIFKVNLFLQP